MCYNANVGNRVNHKCFLRHSSLIIILPSLVATNRLFALVGAVLYWGKKEIMDKRDNLRPFTSEQSREEAKINGRKGGIASGEKRKQIKTFKEMLEILLQQDTEVEGEKMTNLQAVSVALLKKALGGDINAIQTLRDTAGQKPVENLSVEIEKNEGMEEMQDALIQLAKNGINTNK